MAHTSRRRRLGNPRLHRAPERLRHYRPEDGDENLSDDGYGLGDMVQGYLDGRSDSRLQFPDTLSNRGHAYRHGWLNGRDDRTGKPRDTAANLRAQASIAEQMDQGTYFKQ